MIPRRAKAFREVPAAIELRIDRAKKPRAVLALAHGAGAGMDTPFLVELAQGLAAEGITVVRFEFAYMAARREGRRLPPERMPTLEARFASVAAAIRKARLRGPLFVGGKSMGGRVATHVADTLTACGVLAYGYPFHPPGKPTQLRVAHLASLKAPCLIIQGTRDPFGTPAEVATYPLGDLSIHWIEDGDHSFKPRKQSGRTLRDNMRDAIAATSAFVARVFRDHD